jgi:hypothetical protein
MSIERMRERLAADRESFIEPCLPSPADKPPSGSNWIHEIKHDGYRLMARRDPVGIRLITRNGHDRAGDQFDTLVVVRHKPVLEDSLKPSRLCRVSGRNGGQFMGGPLPPRGRGRESPQGAVLPAARAPMWSFPPR